MPHRKGMVGEIQDSDHRVEFNGNYDLEFSKYMPILQFNSPICFFKCQYTPIIKPSWDFPHYLYFFST